MRVGGGDLHEGEGAGFNPKSLKSKFDDILVCKKIK